MISDFGINTGKQSGNYPCAFLYKSEDGPVGSFSSPNFPGLYPRDTECHYLFYGTNLERVRIKFSYFDIEGYLP
jgi:hypothetical protein